MKKNYKILLLALTAVFVLIPVFNVRAEENEEYSATDYEQDERLNFLEVRLEEMGYSIEEVNGQFEIVRTSVEELQEENLTLSDKLDFVIIALDSLINNSNLELNNHDLDKLETIDFRLSVLEGMGVNNTALEMLGQDTVSGNTTINESLKINHEKALEAQEKSDVLFMQYQTYLLIMVGIVIGVVMAIIFSRFIHGK